jgi:hypothetical protein
MDHGFFHLGIDVAVAIERASPEALDRRSALL